MYLLLKLLVAKLPAQYMKALESKAVSIRETIEHNRNLWNSSKEEILAQVIKSIDLHLKTLEGIYDPSPGENIFIPDTNALLANPNIENWYFDDVDKLTLVLLPTVLSELDGLKINGKKEELREKAKTLINKIKEYRRRGNITDGVTPLCYDSWRRDKKEVS